MFGEGEAGVTEMVVMAVVMVRVATAAFQMVAGTVALVGGDLSDRDEVGGGGGVIDC